MLGSDEGVKTGALRGAEVLAPVRSKTPPLAPPAMSATRSGPSNERQSGKKVFEWTLLLSSTIDAATIQYTGIAVLPTSRTGPTGESLCSVV